MTKIFNYRILAVFVSAVFTFFNICRIEFLFSWICFVPLFIYIIDSIPRESFKTGLLFGFAFSIFCFYWVIPGAEKFTGNSPVYGILAWCIFAAFFSVFYGLILYLFSHLKIQEESRKALWINSLLIATLFTLAEFFLLILSGNFPWFAVYAGNGLAANMYSIQPAAILGISILTFVAVFVNYLFAYFIHKKEWKKCWIPATTIALFLIAGFIVFKNFQSKTFAEKSFTVAILSENIPPEMKWDEQNGNYLVEKILTLNRSAAALKPDVALWSESAIPWTYKKDDDLVNEILKTTTEKPITHILGINSEYKDNVVFNSAYAILPDGEVTGRYDKQYLLSIIEKPLKGFLMPFFSNTGFSVVNDSIHDSPLNTPFGKAGILICNEAVMPAAAATAVNKGAQFLFNMSNDGWFSDTYIPRLHFYSSRLRAVESRKDMVVNANNGFSGLINASGEIAERKRSEDPFVKLVHVQPNNVRSIATLIPGLFIYCCTIYLLFIIGLKIAQKININRKPIV